MDGRHSFVGLVSGGKDSVFSIYKLVNEGHKLVCLANLYPQGSNELDSFMFQSVGSEVIEHLETVMGVPLYRAPILGTSKIISLDYTIDKDDEIEDLHNLLEKIKGEHSDVSAVSCGAIASQYQKNRLYDVCRRLGMEPLCPLWGKNESEILHEMIESGLEAIIIKTACAGLLERHLSHPINSEFFEIMKELQTKYGAHVCGEGGEYESLVLYCPKIYRKRIIIKKSAHHLVQPDKVAPVQFMEVMEIELQKPT